MLGISKEENESIEEEEEERPSQNSFINDTSQLGTMTQDTLDAMEEMPGARRSSRRGERSAATQRSLDFERERDAVFAVPQLNRRAFCRSSGIDASATQDSIGVLLDRGGKKYFVVLVNELTQGGDCETTGE